MLTKLSWELSLKYNQVEKSFGEKIDFKSLINVLTGHEQSYRAAVLREYFSRYSYPSSVRAFHISLSQAALFSLMLILIFILLADCAKKRPQQKKAYGFAFACVALQSALYICGLCLSYMYKFPEEEAVVLASYSRYMGIMHNFLVFFFLMTLIKNIESMDNKLLISSALLFLCVVTGKFNTAKNFLRRDHIKQSLETVDYYAPLVGNIINVIPYDSSTFFVAQDCYGFNILYVRYQTVPRKINDTVEIIGNLGTTTLNPNFHIHFETASQWKEELLNNYDYVVLYNLNDEFYEKFSSLFSDQGSIVTWGIYSVNKQTGLLDRCR